MSFSKHFRAYLDLNFIPTKLLYCRRCVFRETGPSASQITGFRPQVFNCQLILFFSRIVTETTFTNECENIVQHICEEHYHVPVPVPTHVHHPPPPPPHVPFGPVPNPNGKRRRRRKRSSSSVERKRKKRASGLERQELILGLKQALGVPPPPTVFHQELPAPPGCRSLVTQKCHKVGKACSSRQCVTLSQPGARRSCQESAGGPVRGGARRQVLL